MRAKDLKAEINKRLSEINEKVSNLKRQLENEGQDSDMEKTFAELEAIRDDIIYQYNMINTLKLNTEEKLKKMELKIFSSIRSFDKAFYEAGGIIKNKRTKNRHHSIDFNNPGSTK